LSLNLVAVGFDDFVEGLGGLRDVLARLDRQLLQLAVVLEGDAELGLALALQALDHVLVVPADLVRQAADLAVLAVGAQGEHSHGDGHDDAAALVVGRWDAVEDTETGEGGLATLGLVWDHACNGEDSPLVKDTHAW